MDKRYQVFISSTFADLKEERGKVQQAVMELDCIPAGMELFPAIDEEQFEFIKKIIDDCDYYLLIIGGRYGSLSDEGVSYTEMEYNYAVDKGIKVIAFLHEDPSSLPVSKSETDAAAREKLTAFRVKASKGRLVKFWNEANELPGLTLSSLTRTIKTYPAVGWVRGDVIADSGVYKELNGVRKENQELRARIAEMLSEAISMDEIADFEDETLLRGYGFSQNGNDKVRVSWSVSVSWKVIFSHVAPILISTQPEYKIESRLVNRLIILSDKADEELKDIGLYTSALERIRIQFMALGLIETHEANNNIFWTMTEVGHAKMMNVLTVKRQDELPF